MQNFCGHGPGCAFPTGPPGSLLLRAAPQI